MVFLYKVGRFTVFTEDGMAGISGFGMNYAMNAYNNAMRQGTGFGNPSPYMLSGLKGPGRAGETEGTGTVKNPGESREVAPGKRVSPAECETCANRKYQDGSDEMVSFKSASHISPTEAPAKVRAHEMEHVSNAYKKAEQGDGKVLQASVKLQTAVCPECGRTYVSGGLTTTRIAYRNEDNPYMKDKKSTDAQALLGRNLDLSV